MLVGIHQMDNQLSVVQVGLEPSILSNLLLEVDEKLLVRAVDHLSGWLSTHLTPLSFV